MRESIECIDSFVRSCGGVVSNGVGSFIVTCCVSYVAWIICSYTGGVKGTIRAQAVLAILSYATINLRSADEVAEGANRAMFDLSNVFWCYMHEVANYVV
jgi:nitrate/nitrite transporter NarK